MKAFWHLLAAVTVVASTLGSTGTARADTIVYTNNFEGSIIGTTGGGVTTTGLTATGTLAGKTLTNAGLGLHTPSFNPNNINLNSQWLGMFNTGSAGATVTLGRNVTKTTSGNEAVRLTLSNLTVGDSYAIRFDLLIGESWDGAASTFGGDFWSFSVNGTRPVDTIFSNVSNGAFGDSSPNAGAYSPQRYTDTNFASPIGPDVNRFTGADAFYGGTSGSYADLYSVYRF